MRLSCVRLAPHPASASALAATAALRLDAAVARHGAALTIEFDLAGELERIRWPPPAPPRRTDGLWQHTCFEAFIGTGVGAGGGYCELNFSPSAQWAAYAFDGYRQGMRPLALAQPPGLELQRDGARARVRLRLAAPELFAALGARADRDDLRLALSAVIEDDSGALGYWALRHPAERPDFHHAAGFVLEVAPLTMGEPG